jgi:large subunit ribosomal protein L30
MARWRVTWKKSWIGYNRGQRETIRSLGLRRLRHTVELPDTPGVRGMLQKVRHMVQAELVPDEASAAPPASQ